ncbi:hypothetical protein QYF36_020606 [Acer negundo]|nr:hypothetical protein QYF36_020606 [Acer negundo]
MFRLSNNLIGILNVITFILSIPILWAGVWLSNKGVTECEKFLDKPLIILGVFLMVISLAGLIGACCRVSWLLWTYLLVMFLLIVILFCFTIFAFVVTNKGAGEVVSERGYKEYRLGDYSNWLQKRVNSTKNWNKIRSCLVDSKVCSTFAGKYAGNNVDEFYKQHLSSVQSGCCKPSTDCQFTYVSPTNWSTTTVAQTNPDCSTWNNDPKTLCYDCQACKAGLLDQVKRDWKKREEWRVISFEVGATHERVTALLKHTRGNDDDNWKKIKNCLSDMNFCTSFDDEHAEGLMTSLKMEKLHHLPWTPSQMLMMELYDKASQSRHYKWRSYIICCGLHCICSICDGALCDGEKCDGSSPL